MEVCGQPPCDFKHPDDTIPISSYMYKLQSRATIDLNQTAQTTSEIMAETSAPPSFNFSSMDWDAYIQFRPVYPEELYATIYAYHDSHGGAYDSAVDVGAGVGIVSAELIKKFSRVVVTDPSEAYVSQAKKHFAAFPQDRLAFVQIKAEELSLEILAEGEKFDLVTAAECLHWADVEKAAPQMATVTKSGVTFAAWLYGGRPVISEQAGILAEVPKIFYDIYDKMCDQYDSQIEKQDEASAGAAMNARLDHIRFSPDAWTDVRRIHTHTDSPMVCGRWPSRASKVTGKEKVEEFANAEILHQEADYEFLEGYLVNWIPPIKVKEFAKTELAKLKETLDGQKIGVTWPFVLVLATRK
nr:methyltransferase tpcm [Quercus suber]